MEILCHHRDGQWIDFDKLIKDSKDNIQMKADTRKVLQNYYENGLVGSSEDIIKILNIYQKNGTSTIFLLQLLSN